MSVYVLWHVIYLFVNMVIFKLSIFYHRKKNHVDFVVSALGNQQEADLRQFRTVYTVRPSK